MSKLYFNSDKELKEYLQKNPVVVAPMAGITDKAFRLLARQFGAGLIYSEMVSAKAITYKNKKTYDLFRLQDEENPIVIQIFGSEPEIMAEAAAFIEETENPAVIDINMGCPVGKVIRNSEGCALMRDYKLAGSIVKAVKKAIKIPVSVKFRSGWDHKELNYKEFALAMEEAGADFMAVHPRTRMQLYSGKADWSVIREVKETVKVPVIASGDVYTGEDYLRLRDETNCDGVMLARGVLGNFHLIKEIHSSIEKIPFKEPNPSEKMKLLEEHFDLLMKYKGEKMATKEIRKFFAWYTKNLPGAAKLRTEVNSIKSSEEFKEFLYTLERDDYFASYNDQRENPGDPLSHT